ncbi:unnamed protein product [Victoria cruziana]
MRLVIEGFLLLVMLLVSIPLFAGAQKAGSNSTRAWKTLTGSRPVVVARGGFSGLVPDSSPAAYQLGQLLSSPDGVSWCNVQLAKDGVGLCVRDLNLANTTNIKSIIPTGQKTYEVNGVSLNGWFTVDYDSSFLTNNISLVQAIDSRSPMFDGSFGILRVDVLPMLNLSHLWLNVEHDVFFTEHKLNMTAYILTESKKMAVDYISSPEVGFLRSIAPTFNGSKTELILTFPVSASIDPSTNLSYSSYLKNLTLVKTFASGILVPKSYIWPTDGDRYLLPHTSLVSDAHAAGLIVFASGFANDNALSYNYTYDPVVEYLSYVNGTDFSVDGMLSDFPVTAAVAIDCFSEVSNHTSVQEKPLVMSFLGSSGIYAGCTDLAYQQAVYDEADILDCPVQMTKDGVPICLSSADLLASTTVSSSKFVSLLKTIPEIQKENGIFTFDLTWEEIQTLRPVIQSPYGTIQGLLRNPGYINAGNFMTLQEFLAFTKNRPIKGILIDIQNAAYLAQNESLDIVDSVIKALDSVGYNNQTKQSVMIQSVDSAVLIKLKESANYTLVYKVAAPISGILPSAIQEIKKFASAVSVGRESVFTLNDFFTSGLTGVVNNITSANLTAYVYDLRNEFTSIYFDLFSDANTQAGAYLSTGLGGLSTGFPATAKAYLNNACYNLKNVPSYEQIPSAGSLLDALLPNLPPSPSLYPSLAASNVTQQALPPVKQRPPSTTAPSSAPPPQSPSSVSPPPQPPSSASHASPYGTAFTAVLLLWFSLLLHA